MPLTLYDAFVPSCRQVFGGVRAMVDKAEQFARDQGMDDAELIEARLAEDMWALPWHVRSCWVQTKLALELVPTGEFSPDFTDIPADWDAMRAMSEEAIAAMDGVSADNLEAIANDTVHFVLGGQVRMSFTVANFLLSFSQPNFYFHATTFYDILRMKGVPLGKSDYLHAPRVLES